MITYCCDVAVTNIKQSGKFIFTNLLHKCNFQNTPLKYYIVIDMNVLNHYQIFYGINKFAQYCVKDSIL